MNKALKVICGILVVLCLLPCITWLLFHTVWKDHLPSALTSVNVTTITDPQTNEVKEVFEAQYYANENGKGKEVVEFRINGYSGSNRQAIYSRGFQLVYGPLIQGTKLPEIYMYYYDSHGEESHLSDSPFEYGEKILVDIDGELCAIALTGTYTVYDFNLGKSLWFAFSGLFTGWGNAYERTHSAREEKYSYQDVLMYLKDMIRSCSNGTGDSVIDMADMAEFFSVYAESENGKFTTELGYGTQRANYFSVKCHYDKRGMQFAKQSLFGSVEGNSDFNISGVETNVVYWKVEGDFVIDERMFEPRETSNGKYLYLREEFKNELKNYQDESIYVDLDLDKLAEDVKGFDYLALAGLELDGVNIRGNNKRSFEIQYNSLNKTGIAFKDVTHSQGVTLVEVKNG